MAYECWIRIQFGCMSSLRIQKKLFDLLLGTSSTLIYAVLFLHLICFFYFTPLYRFSQKRWKSITTNNIFIDIDQSQCMQMWIIVQYTLFFAWTAWYYTINLYYPCPCCCVLMHHPTSTCSIGLNEKNNNLEHHMQKGKMTLLAAYISWIAILACMLPNWIDWTDCMYKGVIDLSFYTHNCISFHFIPFASLPWNYSWVDEHLGPVWVQLAHVQIIDLILFVPINEKIHATFLWYMYCLNATVPLH